MAAVAPGDIGSNPLRGSADATSEALHAEAIAAAARAHGELLPDHRAQELGRFGRRLEPIDEVPGAL